MEESKKEQFEGDGTTLTVLTMWFTQCICILILGISIYQCIIGKIRWEIVVIYGGLLFAIRCIGKMLVYLDKKIYENNKIIIKNQEKILKKLG